MPELPEPQGLKIYVVNNASGGVLNSAWTDETLANARAVELNGNAYTLAYTVTPITLQAA